MSRKGGLGSGLDALFGVSDEPEQIANSSYLPLVKIEPRVNQPRENFQEDSLAELADSIRLHGIIQPITVRPIDKGYYQIIAGERRWRAAKLAGLAEVPVNIVEADEKTVTELALVENLQREDLNPLEEAKGFRQLIDEFGLTQEEAAKAVGKSRPSITNALRLLTLNEYIQSMISEGQISSGHARALLGLDNSEEQELVLEEILKKNLSVRQTEKLVSKYKSNKAKHSTYVSAQSESSDSGLSSEVETVKTDTNSNAVVSVDSIDYIHEAEKDLENALGRKVRFNGNQSRGSIYLEFYSNEDREALISDLILIGNRRKNQNSKELE